jgi:hypothetical protein
LAASTIQSPAAKGFHGWILGVQGKRDSALALLTELERLGGRPGGPVDWARTLVLAGLGDSTRAAAGMANLVEGSWLFELCNPKLDAARRQPVMQALIRRIGLSDAKACRDSP